MGEGFRGEGSATIGRYASSPELIQRGGVVNRIREDDDTRKILGGGADHGGTADVDLLEGVGKGDSGASDGAANG